jgi:hypothetical protein
MIEELTRFTCEDFLDYVAILHTVTCADSDHMLIFEYVNKNTDENIIPKYLNESIDNR